MRARRRPSMLARGRPTGRGRRRPEATVRAMMWRWRGVLACNFSPRFFLPGLGRSSLSCNLKRGCMPLLARCYSEPAGGPWMTRLKRVVISCRPPRAFARRFAGRGEKAGLASTILLDLGKRRRKLEEVLTTTVGVLRQAVGRSLDGARPRAPVPRLRNACKLGQNRQHRAHIVIVSSVGHLPELQQILYIEMSS